MILLHQSLHEDREMGECVVARDIAQLIAIVELKEKPKQVGPQSQTLFAAVAVAVDQRRLPLQQVLPAAIPQVPAWQICLKAKVAEGLLDPVGRFRRRSGAHAQRDLAGAFQGQRRKRLESGDAAAKFPHQFGSLNIVNNGNIPESVQVPSLLPAPTRPDHPSSS